jgi:hypothetical protein
MKRRAFTVLAAIFLLLAVGLCYGYIAQVGPSFAYFSPRAVETVNARGFQLIGDRGRIEAEFVGGQGPLPPGAHMGLNFDWRHGGPHLPGLGRSIWEFDAHSYSIPPSAGAPGTYNAFFMACPLWCLILPSLVAPVIWYRRRVQSRRHPRGFEVQQRIAPSV